MLKSQLENTQPPWAVTSEKVDSAVRRVIEVAHPKKIYLFGSYVNPRADGRPPRDLDMLVVVDDSVEKDYEESARIRLALRGIRMPMDILVARAGDFAAHAQSPGRIFREILSTGRNVYDAVAA